MNICIYCACNNPTKFTGVEHVLPQAFGLFGPWTPTLDCVCDDCNGYFGRGIDSYLARETLEGVLRYQKGRLSSELRPQKHLHITLEPGPETGQLAGMKVAIDGTTGALMAAKAQFQILNQKTGNTEVYFKHQLAGLRLPEAVYGRPGKADIAGNRKWDIRAPSKEEYYELVAILKANGIAVEAGEPYSIPPPAPDSAGQNSVPLLIEGEVTSDHRRAHGKIFVNLIAKYFGCEEAMKADWEFLRRYARYAEGEIKYLIYDPPLPPDEELKLIVDSILISIFNWRGHVCGDIQFYGKPTYRYVLSEDAAASNEHEFGFLFAEGKQPRAFMLGNHGASDIS